MPALRELQTATADAVFGTGMIPELDEARLSAEVATAIYRNNLQGNAFDALRGAFPAVCGLLGEDCFEGLVQRYLTTHPSRSGDLHELGTALPGFLALVPEFEALAYLPDVARLEWLQRTVLLAADPRPFDFAGLAALPEADFGRLRFRLAPAAGWLQSPWPLLAIWHMARAAAEGDEDDAPPVDLHGGGQRVLVWRDGEDLVRTEEIPAGVLRMLETFRLGGTFDEACDQAWSEEAALDVGEWLHRLVARNVIAEWRPVAAEEAK